jgi:vacuolar-type H+-ATPase subunit I/STV1
MINETFLRKAQAAMIIANSLKYTPGKNETPAEIISRAIASKPKMNDQESKIVTDMLRLAESIEEDDDLTDEELNKLAAEVTDWEHTIEAYEGDELCIVDQDTDEVLEDDLSGDLKESEELNEVLSRVERIKARMRFARTSGKRARATKLALKRHSSNTKINKRARKLAVSILKRKFARGQDISKMGFAQKARIEKMIEGKAALVGRLALKLTSRIRTIEKNRLSHKSVTRE